MQQGFRDEADVLNVNGKPSPHTGQRLRREVRQFSPLGEETQAAT